MAEIDVRHLRYRGAAALAGRAEAEVADALRTEVADDGRLVLVRRFALGRIAPGGTGTARVTAQAWREMVGSARHGGSGGAAEANCVWFRDAAEARTLLLRELAQGRAALAWFWPLAVPDWGEVPLPEFVERLVRGALADPGGQAMAALIEEAVGAGCTEPLAAAILRLLPPVVPRGDMVRTGGGDTKPRQPPSPVAEPPSGPAPIRELALAAAVTDALPRPLRDVLRTSAASAAGRPLAKRIVRGLVLRLHPALSLAPPRLESVEREVLAILRGERSAPRPTAAPEPARRHARAQWATPVARAAPAPFDPALTGETAPAARLSAEQASPAPPHAIPEPPPPLSLPTEIASAAAGLFLTITPLIRLGWREWLAARPELLLHRPGPRLLAHIAAHHRVAASDAVWALLPDRAEPVAREMRDAAALWRTALDRWLRRTAQVKLADVVARRGWIIEGPETTVMRFPLSSIDIRLRRHALDLDPGWVDWLGRSYRLVYRDRPLIEAVAR